MGCMIMQVHLPPPYAWAGGEERAPGELTARFFCWWYYRPLYPWLVYLGAVSRSKALGTCGELITRESRARGLWRLIAA